MSNVAHSASISALLPLKLVHSYSCNAATVAPFSSLFHQLNDRFPEYITASISAHWTSLDKLGRVGHFSTPPSSLIFRLVARVSRAKSTASWAVVVDVYSYRGKPALETRFFTILLEFSQGRIDKGGNVKFERNFQWLSLLFSNYIFLIKRKKF